MSSQAKRKISSGTRRLRAHQNRGLRELGVCFRCRDTRATTFRDYYSALCAPPRTFSIGLAREDECRAGHNRRACTDERHVDILDLTRAGATRGLEGALDDVP